MRRLSGAKKGLLGRGSARRFEVPRAACLGAGLDVLEYEKASFESLFSNKKNVSLSIENQIPDAMRELMFLNNVILSPHVAGWTKESHERLASVIAGKIIDKFGKGE